MTTAPSIEERLRRARGMAAVIAKLADQASAASGEAPSPAFWAGVSSIASLLEDDVAAVQQALSVEMTERPAPTAFVER